MHYVANLALIRCGLSTSSDKHIIYSVSPHAAERSFSSIFLRAFRIISSRLLLSKSCRSSLLLDHEGAFTNVLSDTLSLVSSNETFDARLYLVIRSGCGGRGGAASCVGADVGGNAGWKEGGGCKCERVSIEKLGL